MNRLSNHKFQFSFITAFLVIVVFSMLPSHVALAGTVNVAPGVVVIDPADGQCSLLEAIEKVAHGSIHPNCGSTDPNPIPNTISLAPGSTYTLTTIPTNTAYPADYQADGPNGAHKLDSIIIIEGNGATITRSSGTAFRIFNVSSAGTVTINNLTISGGQAASSGGSGIFNRGYLTLNNVTITGNSASLDGGGIYNLGGTVNINNSTISNNSVNTGNNGGAIRNSNGGIINISGGSIANNTAKRGGGIYNSSGSVTINGMTISSNLATVAGGGLFLSAGSMTVSNSNLTSNTVNNCSGTIGDGGGNTDSDGSCGFTTVPSAPVYTSNPAPNNTIVVGSVTVGSSVDFLLPITNTGNANLTVGFTSITPGDYSITSAMPLNIAPSATQNVSIRCTPSSATTINGTLTLNTNDTSNVTVSYPLQCTGTVGAAPGYSSTPAVNGTINFGSVLVGSSANRTLTINNPGTADLTVNLNGLSVGYGIVSPAMPLVIPPSGTQDVTISCTPTAASPFNGTLSLTTDAPGQATADYSLTCTGVNTPPAGGTGGTGTTDTSVDLVIEVPSAPPLPPCSADSTEVVRATINGQPTQFSFCRVLAENGDVGNGAAIGNPDVLAQGVIHAVDVFGIDPTIVVNIEVCLRGQGGMIYLDASQMPRTPQWMPTIAKDGYTCTTIPRVGMVVLTHNNGYSGPPLPNNTASTTTSSAPVASTPLNGCRVTTTHMVNLREQPNTTSGVITVLPYDITLTATERTTDWFRVIFEDKQGWVHGDYLNTGGSCG